WKTQPILTKTRMVEALRHFHLGQRLRWRKGRCRVLEQALQLDRGSGRTGDVIANARVICTEPKQGEAGASEHVGMAHLTAAALSIEQRALGNRPRGEEQ